MVSAVIIAVVALVAGVVLLELLTGAEPHSRFFFALLDRLVSDESDIPDSITAAVAKRSSQRAA